MRREVNNHEHFRELVRRVAEVNELICEERPVESAAVVEAGDENRGSMRISARRSKRK